MSIIYGFGRVAVQGLEELCVGQFEFQYQPQLFQYKYFNSARQLFLPADTVALTAREYFITVTCSLYNYELLKVIFGSEIVEPAVSLFLEPPVNQPSQTLVLSPDVYLKFTGVAFTAGNKRIVFSANNIVPVEISAIEAGSPLIIKFVVASIPQLKVDSEEEDVNFIAQVDLDAILLTTGGKLIWT
jgi:hypothetical protein